MNNDYMIRATAADDTVRAFIASTKELAEHGREVHDTTPVVTAALGRLLTAGVMMGTMLKGEHDEITLRIQGDGPIGTLLVSADSHGTARGYVSNPKVYLPPKRPGKLDVGKAVGAGALTVIRDTGLGEPYSGQVDLVSGEIAEDLTTYFATSEQIPSSVALGVLVAPDYHVMQAGGMIIQLMPNADEAVISELEKTLADIPSMTQMLEAGMMPENILQRVLGAFAPKVMDMIPLSYRCTCSQERVESAIRSLSADDLHEMVQDEKPIEVKCQFCGKQYEVSLGQLRDMAAAKTTS